MTKSQRSPRPATFSQFIDTYSGLYVDCRRMRVLLMSPIEHWKIMTLAKKYASLLLKMRPEFDEAYLKDLSILLQHGKEYDYAQVSATMMLAELSFTNAEVESDVMQYICAHIDAKAPKAQKKFAKRNDGENFLTMEHLRGTITSVDTFFFTIYATWRTSRWEKSPYPLLVEDFIHIEAVEYPYALAGHAFLQAYCIEVETDAELQAKNKEISVLMRQVKRQGKTVEGLERENTKLKSSLAAAREAVKKCEKTEDMQQRIDKLQKQNDGAQSKISRQEQALCNLNKQLREKDKTIEILESYRDFALLRESSMEDVDDTSESTRDEWGLEGFSLPTLLEGRRLIMIGGPPRLKQRLTGALNELGINYRIILEDTSGRFPQFEETDVLLVNILGMSHAYYYRVRSTLKTYNNKVYFTDKIGVPTILRALEDYLLGERNEEDAAG